MSRLISVLIPSYDRPARLARCLEALAAQTLPHSQYEVVICDDGSPEPLTPLAESFADILSLTVVTQPNAGPAAARNAAARQARGSHLAFTDDDCIPAPDWLERLAHRVAATPDHLIGGGIENALTEDPYATATQHVGDAVNAHYERRGATERFFSTSNLLVPAEAFRALGGFSEAFRRAAGEDYDFCARWYAAGLPGLWAPEAVVRHAHGHTLGSFWRQHFDYGRSLLRVRQRMARRGTGRLRFETPRFYAWLVAYPLRRVRGADAWRGAALVLLSQVATAAGGLREALRGEAGAWHGADTPERNARAAAPVEADGAR